MFKKILLLVLSLSVACVSLVGLTACGAPRDQILKINNWGDYFDMSVINDFEAWYKDTYGKKITVQYNTFDNCEEVYTKIAVEEIDYDLICPSDYMVKKMYGENLIKPMDLSRIDNLPFSDWEPKLVETAKVLFGEGNVKEDLSYGIPFHWGTTGIMWDAEKLPAGVDTKSWGAFWSGQNMYMKKSVTDCFEAAMLYNNRTELLRLADVGTGNEYPDAYKTYFDGLFGVPSEQSVTAVNTAWRAQRGNVAEYDVDAGKWNIANRTPGAPSFGLFWSCDAGLAMFNEGSPSNTDLRYYVPDEGSWLWLDYWLIPKFAKNDDAAYAFLNFINKPENQRKNLEYNGAVGPSKTANAAFKEYIDGDENGIFKGNAVFKQNYIDAVFPTESQLKRSGVRQPFGSRTEDITGKFVDVISNV